MNETLGRPLRVCFITEGFPYPLTSGRLRHNHLLRQLKQTCAIKLICVSSKEADAETRRELAAIASELDVVAMPSLNSPHRTIRWTAGRALRRRLLHSCRSFAPEALFMTCGLPVASLPVDVAPIVLDFCDAEWPKIRERAQLASFPAAWRLHARAARIRRYERQLARRVDHAVFAAARDADHVMQGISTPHSVIPNGVDVAYWQRSTRSIGQNTVLFAGAFSYFPNVDAATFLASEVFPRIRRDIPDARLLLVGRDPPVALKALHAPPVVTVTGLVPDMRPYYEDATVVVAPLRIAGGIQNKVLESLALEIPVVTTTAGFAGLGQAREDLLLGECEITVADTAEAIAAAAVDSLRRHSNDRQSVAGNRAFVMRHFSWHESAARVQALLGQVRPTL